MSRFNCKVVEAVPIVIQQRFNDPRSSFGYSFYLIYKIRDNVESVQISLSILKEYKEKYVLQEVNKGFGVNFNIEYKK